MRCGTTLSFPRIMGTLILTEFDNFMAELLERRKVAPHPHYLSLGSFRVSLRECFKKFGITATYLFELKEWKVFGRHYCSRHHREGNGR
jgi:hypothetical protein